MTTLDIDYPKTETWTLGDALADARRRLEDVEATLRAERKADDPDEAAIREARSERSQYQTEVSGLEWAVGTFGGDSEITLQSVTAGERSRAIGTARQRTVGTVTPTQLNDWVLAACLRDAPWIGCDDDLVTVYETTTELPPAFADWLRARSDELNDLSEGN